MIYLYIFILTVVLLLLYMRFEAGFVELRHVILSKNSKGLKILQISDIHINKLKVPIRSIQKILRKTSPDLVVITGDYIEKKEHINSFLKFLDSIKGKYDICLCLGNHDYKAFINDKKGISEFISLIKSKGIKVLHNQSLPFEKGSRTYNIIGIEDLREGAPDIKKALETCRKDAYANIAISHNPDIVLNMPNGSIDYLFCGHFHGGQIWMPFNLEYRILREDKLCKMGIRRGLHKFNGINLYINRGLGNVCIPLRFLSRPEITVYHLP